MDIQKIDKYKSAFDQIVKTVKVDDRNVIEMWYARWEDFVVAIGRAMESCKTLGVNVDDHFRDLTKMVSLGSGSERPIQDYMLTRYACYLIAQNGAPKKNTCLGI